MLGCYPHAWSRYSSRCGVASACNAEYNREPVSQQSHCVRRSEEEDRWEIIAARVMEVGISKDSMA
jgi:hypothetical protein